MWRTQGACHLEKFGLAATQAVLYFNSISAGETIKLHYRLRAKYPITRPNVAVTGLRILRPELKPVAVPVATEVRKSKLVAAEQLSTAICSIGVSGQGPGSCVVRVLSPAAVPE